MYQSIIGVLVAIVLILAWWIAAHPGTTPASATTATTTAASQAATGSMTAPATGSESASQQTPVVSSTSASGDTVSIVNQPAGDSVAVASVTLAQPGWVAIRDSSGRTLGAAWFDTGTHTNVVVPLLRGTEAGQSYQALLYVDNGDHQFSLHADTLITNSDGSVPGTTFSTTQAAQ